MKKRYTPRLFSVPFFIAAFSIAYLTAEGNSFAQTAQNGYYYYEPTYTNLPTQSPFSGETSYQTTTSENVYQTSQPTSSQTCSPCANSVSYASPEQYNSKASAWLDDISLEMTVGWGYMYKNTLKVEAEKAKENFISKFIRETFNWGTDAALTIVNFNADLMLHFPVSKYYTIGVGVQSKFLSKAFLTLDNRIRIPLLSGNAIFLDFPVGVNVVKFTKDQPVFDLGARVGIILMGEGHFGFIMHLGTDVVLAKVRDEWRKLASVRAGLGLLIAF